MKSAKIALTVIAALLAASSAYGQTVYRWVDKDGKVHFSDTPPLDADATQKRVGGGAGDDTQLPYATQMAMKRSPVTLYSSSRCGEICTSGRELLVKRGIPYSEKNPEGNPADLEALKKLVGTPEVPVLVVGDKPIKGYHEGTWQGALDDAGYPRSLLPGQRPPTPPTPPAPPPPATPAEGTPQPGAAQ